MNFIETFKKGQKGYSKGLPMGKGLSSVSKQINGVQRGMLYGLAGGPKSGKSTLTDNGFVIEPYLDALENNVNIEIIYNSYEIDRVSKEFDFAAFFLNYDYGIETIILDEGVTKDGNKEVELSSKYLMGRLLDDNLNLIKVKDTIIEVLKETYEKRIIPLFGEFSDNGVCITKGIITFLDNRDNPTGIRNFLLDHAKKNGKFQKESFKKASDNKTYNRIVGYTPNDPNKFTLVVTDHLRKLIPERGFTLKQTVDKYIEYSVELRNWTGYSFLHIIHLNRNMTDLTRLKYAGDLLYPNGDDVKETGNLSEEVDYMFTLFNPNDERYNLEKHFGVRIKDTKGNILYPNMRTLHLVENRHGDSPIHFRLKMLGNIKKFEKLEII